MFLLDNQVVREDWKKAKAIVSDTIEKHGGKVTTLRRFDERKLAYTIRRRNRGTFFLAYFEIPGGAIPAMRRDLELSERVLRYLMLAVESVPENEATLSSAENAADFVVPAPPPDDMVEPEPAPPEVPEVIEAPPEEIAEDGERPRGKKTEDAVPAEVRS
jgi:small subunit ribosomal protein S6